MKKFLIVLLAVVLLLTGLFFWKGGHHALYLLDKLEDWMDEDTSDQQLSVSIDDLTLSGDTFWMERGGRRVYGLTSDGYAVYLREDVLYMDTGTAYSLPEFETDPGQVRKILLAAVLQGRITKEGGVYVASMETEELTFEARIRASDKLEALEFEAELPLNGAVTSLSGSMTVSPARSHTIPQEVLDAMVRADLEKPISLPEPLNALLPALEDLEPLSADVTLGVECGILTLSETVQLYAENGTAQLERGGVRFTVAIPEEFSDLSPVTAGLVLLRSADFTQTPDGAQFRIALDAESTAQLCEALLPQTAELGLTFETSEAVLTIQNGRLVSASVSADGSVPFLVTTIPVSFSAEFDIH